MACGIGQRNAIGTRLQGYGRSRAARQRIRPVCGATPFPSILVIMLPSQPQHCRPAAYERFVAQLPELETTAGLLRAAVAVAAHELGAEASRDVESQLDAFAGRVLKRVSSARPSAVLAHVHRVRVEEEGFSGNPGDYYNARNSYLPAVLESKRGIPITLVLIYKCVAEGAGLSVYGVNAPGHFLGEVEMDGRPALIDPFYGGRMLTREEAVKQIAETTGQEVAPLAAAVAEADHQDPFMPRATHRQWIARLIRNLRGVYADTGRQRDVEAMGELFELL